MKFFTFRKKIGLLFALFIVLAGKTVAQYGVGDFGSTSSGDWTTSIWSTWNGSTWVPTGASPNSIDNVFILSGSNVVVNNSPRSCLSLNVETGAQLWTNSGTNVYLYVYGPNLVCDGQIGNGATFDGISFGIEGATCTITGSGTFDASRMRKNQNTPSTDLYISRDINLRWNAATTTQLYNASTNTNFNVTINAGSTVNLIPSGPSTGNVCIDGLDGTGAPEAGGTFTVNGNLIISGKLYLTTNNTSTTYATKWVISGLVRANEIVATSSGAATCSLTINNLGRLDITGTPAWSSLGIVNNTYIYNIGSTIEYSANGNQAVRVASEFGGSANSRYWNLVLSNSGNKSTSLNDLWIRNNLTISGTSVLDPNPANSVIYVGGNWLSYNQAGFSEKSTAVWINGSALQTITCPGGEIYNILRYSKGAGTYLQFNNNIDLDSLVYASNGYIDLNSNMLTITNSLTSGITGANSSRYIVSEKTNNSSKIKWRINTSSGTYIYPFGIAPGGNANYIPVAVAKSNTSNIGDVTVSTYGTPANNLPWPTTPTNVTNLKSFVPANNTPDNRDWTVDRFWEMTSTSPITIDSVRFSYRASELPIADPNPANLGAQFWNSTYWYNQQYGTGQAHNVIVPSFFVFNTAWTLSSLLSPLPIELLSFDATPLEEKVELKWMTATEINNDFFTVEKSIDAFEFYEIGTVPGAGTTTNERSYVLDDMKPFPGISYYRLKQTDYDGTFSYSRTIPVTYKSINDNFTIFPNPAPDMVYLASKEDVRPEIIIRNAEGRLIQHFLTQSSKQIHSLHIADLTPGLYIVEIRYGDQSQHIRLIKN